MKNATQNGRNASIQAASKSTSNRKSPKSIGEARESTLPVQHRICTYKSRGTDFFCYLIWSGHIQIKKVHIPGGNIAAKQAKARAALVLAAITRGDRPQEILAMLARWRREDLTIPRQMALGLAT